MVNTHEIIKEAPHIFMRPVEDVPRWSIDWQRVMIPSMRRKMWNVMEAVSKTADELGGGLTLRGSAVGELIRRKDYSAIDSKLWHISEYWRYRDRKKFPNNPDPLTLYQFPMDINFKAPFSVVEGLGKYMTKRFGISFLCRYGMSEEKKWKGKNIYSAATSGTLSFDPPIPYAAFGFFASDPVTRAEDAICAFNIFPEGDTNGSHINRRGLLTSFNVDGSIRFKVISGSGYPFALEHQGLPRFVRMEPEALEYLERRLHTTGAVRYDAALAILECARRAVRIATTYKNLIGFEPRDALHKDARRLIEEAVNVKSESDPQNIALQQRDVAVSYMLDKRYTGRLMEAWGVGKTFSASELHEIELSAKDYRGWRYAPGYPQV